MKVGFLEPLSGEVETFMKLTESEYRYFQTWVRQHEALDRKATAIMTLDGLMLALTASLLGASLFSQTPFAFRTLFSIGTILILVSAGSCAMALRVKHFLTEVIASSGDVNNAYISLKNARAFKSRYLDISIMTLLIALLGYGSAILTLLVR